MKLYKHGLIIGRFQLLHNGHKQMIDTALELCDKVVVYIGSSQESRTLENPFTFEERIDMFNKVFESEVSQKRLIVRALPDIGAGNNDIWGRYVLGTFEAEFHKQPDLYITGCEKNRSSWFNNEIAPKVDELVITRNRIDVSASDCRKALKERNTELLEKYLPVELWGDLNGYAVILDGIKMLPKIWVYRFEHTDPTKGIWYNVNGNFCCTHPVLKKLDMPYEPDVYQGIYKSSCKNAADMVYWVPREVAEDMLSQGYIATKYLTDDYFERDHGEICFNKTNYIKKEIVTLDEIYGVKK